MHAVCVDIIVSLDICSAIPHFPAILPRFSNFFSLLHLKNISPSHISVSGMHGSPHISMFFPLFSYVLLLLQINNSISSHFC